MHIIKCLNHRLTEARLNLTFFDFVVSMTFALWTVATSLLMIVLIGPTRWTKKNTPLMLEFIVLLDRCIIFAVFVYSCIFIKRRCSLSTDVN